jgi:hypothetical protein
MHALQALPLLAAVLGLVRLPRLRDDLVRFRLVLVGAGLYAGVFALTLWQALRGQAVTSPDALTVIALLILLAATGVGVKLALRTDERVAVAA